MKFFKKVPVKMQKNHKTSKTTDTYVTSLEDADKTHSNIDLNGYKSYVNNVEINK